MQVHSVTNNSLKTDKTPYIVYILMQGLQSHILSVFRWLLVSMTK